MKKSSSEEEERRKEEGSAVEWIISSPTVQPSQPAKSSHRSAHFPRIRAIAILRDEGPLRSSAIRCSPNVASASGESSLRGDDARTFVVVRV